MARLFRFVSLDMHALHTRCGRAQTRIFSRIHPRILRGLRRVRGVFSLIIQSRHGATRSSVVLTGPRAAPYRVNAARG